MMHLFERKGHNEFRDFLSLSNSEKRLLINVLGYDTDENDYIIDAGSKEKVICRYTKSPIRFEDASILPGSTIIINSTPVTLSLYIDEFLENND